MNCSDSFTRVQMVTIRANEPLRQSANYHSPFIINVLTEHAELIETVTH